jgi:hypothetical protein
MLLLLYVIRAREGRVKPLAPMSFLVGNASIVAKPVTAKSHIGHADSQA